MASWGYTYPGTQQPMVNQVYQQTPPTAIYLVISYPGNTFLP